MEEKLKVVQFLLKEAEKEIIAWEAWKKKIAEAKLKPKPGESWYKYFDRYSYPALPQKSRTQNDLQKIRTLTLEISKEIEELSKV